MHCPECGGENTEASKFCVRCGTKLAVPESQEEPAPMADDEARCEEAIRFIRQRTEAGESRESIAIHLMGAGWTLDDFGAIWLRASAERAVDAPAAAARPTADIGLWGPAEAFPDIVELLEAGQWGEASAKARSKRRRGRQSKIDLAETQRFVRLLAACVDGDEELDAAEEQQLLTTALKDVTPPVTMLDYLLLAVVRQSTDPRRPSIGRLGGSRVRDMLSEVARSTYVDDPGLSVLEPWRDTPLESQLLYWLSGFGAGDRDAGKVACCRRLLDVLERPGPGNCDLLQLARVEWVLGQMVGDVEGGEWSDRATMTAWQYVSEVAPHEVVFMWGSLLEVLEPNAADTWRVLGSLVPGSGLYRGLPGPSQRGCVLRFWRVQREGESAERDVWNGKVVFYDDGFSAWSNTFCSERFFQPFAAVSDVNIRPGMVWTGVTVSLHGGHRSVNNDPWSRENAEALKRRFDEWRGKWGDIADGRRRPEREWLSDR